MVHIDVVLGVYVHFPYCAAICPYCDFAVARRAVLPHDELADAVLAELDARAAGWDGAGPLVSVYFGGGTPSLWRPDCVARVLDGIRRRFGAPPVGDALEVTLEANPERLDGEALARLRDAGVNRLSVGAQSFAPRHLAVLGREHGPADTARAVEDARRAGFANLSLDLMYALPSQTQGEVAADLDALVALAPEHVSIYCLTVEKRTPFHAFVQQGRLALVGADDEDAMHARIVERIEAAGFAHYEISSFARPGRQAVHNTLYWSGGEWLGLGPSAHSFRLTDGRGERSANVRAARAYLERLRAGATAVESCETVDAEALARDAVWLGLRMLERGVERGAFRARFGDDPVARFADEWATLAGQGLVEVTPERVRLTRRGARFADAVGARFV